MHPLSRGVPDDPAPGLTTPTYDRSAISPGIAHIGVGGFHRSHQAVYLDELLGLGRDREWGIVGIGLLEGDEAMHRVLCEQDGLYTVVTKHADGSRDARIVGSIIDHVLAPPSRTRSSAPASAEPALDVLCDPRIRIVSLTITEGGYHADDATGQLVLDGALRADLVPGATPATAFGHVVEAIARRRAAGTPPFTVMSCDNIEGNGDLAREMITAFAALRDPSLAAWLTEHVAFPNSMVDRITPATTDADRLALATDFGIEDAWPVVAEPFTQWVLEDRFASGRPELEAVGVQLVDDVRPYELMKLRLLNAGHQLVAHLGALLGHRHVHDALADPLVADLLGGYLRHEAAPSLDPVPGIDTTRYQAEILARFANPHVADSLARIRTDASDRIPKFLLPVIRAQLASGGPVHRATLVVAAWARCVAGEGDLADRRAGRLRELAQRAVTDPPAFLEERSIFGDLIADERFTALFTDALRSLHQHGVRATLERWAGDDVAPRADR